MALETGTYIDDFVLTNPTGADDRSTADDHLRLIKSFVQASFPNITGAMTATQAQLNFMVGVTSAVQTQLNNLSSGKQAADADLTAIAALANTNGNFIVGNGSAWVAESGATARASLSLGALALLSSVAAGQIAADAVSPSTHLNDNITTSNSQSVGASAAWTPPQGIYNMVVVLGGTGNAENGFSIFVSAAWRDGLSFAGAAFFDGSNMRISNGVASTQTTYWQRFNG